MSYSHTRFVKLLLLVITQHQVHNNHTPSKQQGYTGGGAFFQTFNGSPSFFYTIFTGRHFLLDTEKSRRSVFSPGPGLDLPFYIHRNSYMY